MVNLYLRRWFRFFLTIWFWVGEIVRPEVVLLAPTLKIVKKHVPTVRVYKSDNRGFLKETPYQKHRNVCKVFTHFLGVPAEKYQQNLAKNMKKRLF
jgi:hypothetical protein